MLRLGSKLFSKIFCRPSLLGREPLPQKPMVVVITSFNNSKWVQKNLTSVFSQDYTNYRVIYIDDASSDETANFVKSICRDKPQECSFLYIRNNARKGGLCNLYEAVSKCKDDEIIVNLDGDDWFANREVLNIVNKAYSKQDVWLTHGTLIEYPQNVLGWSRPIPKKLVKKNDFRSYRCPSHLKTFYTWLFKKIDLQDLKIAGEFFPVTWDQAIMFPMIEMAGHRHAFISETLYVYNTANTISDNKVNAHLQQALEALIRSKPKYARFQDNYRGAPPCNGA